MKVGIHKSLKAALRSANPLDREVVLVRHELHAGDIIPPHEHLDVDEFVLTDGGLLEITVGDETRTIRSHERCAHVIYIPKGMTHSLKVLRRIEYWVVRY